MDKQHNRSSVGAYPMTLSVTAGLAVGINSRHLKRSPCELSSAGIAATLRPNLAAVLDVPNSPSSFGAESLPYPGHG